MKSREEAARYAEILLDGPDDEGYKAKCDKIHFGRYEVKKLMDFIYEGDPTTPAECVGVVAGGMKR